MEAVEESQFGPFRRLVVRAARTSRATLPIWLPLIGGAALRFWMLNALTESNGDTAIYGGVAKNLLLHGRYALVGDGGALAPTLIRLPGYPLFLAACFRLFGIENYFAVCCVQIVLDLAACLLVAEFARRVAPPAYKRGAMLATLWLAALCPFTASFTPAVLAETLSVFTVALAMWAMARFHDHPGWTNALWFTFAVTGAAFLRPDGALAAVAFAPAIILGLPRAGAGDESPEIRATDGGTTGESSLNPAPALRVPASRGSSRKQQGARARDVRRMAVVCVLLALAPFAVWTWRNWRVFHLFQPLAPRSATDPGEPTYPGWQLWVKSWTLDFISTYEIYWNVPDGVFDVADLPNRAFDSPAQRAETAALAAEYDDNGNQLTPAMDAAFRRLARERIATHPWRYYLWLPLGRLADMWLRPRVEDLDIDLDWWVYARHHLDTEFSWAYGGLNLLYLLLALAGLWLRPRFWQALLAYMLLRSALLFTVEAPETRYTIECFPMIFALGGIALGAGAARILHRTPQMAKPQPPKPSQVLQ
jgi:hypothetical protein